MYKQSFGISLLDFMMPIYAVSSQLKKAGFFNYGVLAHCGNWALWKLDIVTNRFKSKPVLYCPNDQE